MSCLCEWEAGCAGLGIVHCAGCGGDLCVCQCGGESECEGCEDCGSHEPHDEDYDPDFD